MSRTVASTPSSSVLNRVRHDLRRHVGGGVKGVDGHAGPFELRCLVDGGQNLARAALTVRANAGVFSLEHDVVEVDGLLSERAHVHDARRRRGLDERQEQARQEIRAR